LSGYQLCLRRQYWFIFDVLATIEKNIQLNFESNRHGGECFGCTWNNYKKE